MQKFEQTEQYQGYKPAVYIYRGIKIEHTYHKIDSRTIHRSQFGCPVFFRTRVASVPPQRLKGWIDIGLDSPGVYKDITMQRDKMTPEIKEVITRAIQRGYKIKTEWNCDNLKITVSKGLTLASKSLEFQIGKKYARIVDAKNERLNLKLKTKSEMLQYLGIPKLKTDTSE